MVDVQGGEFGVDGVKRWVGVVPLGGKPKSRPRVTRNGTFMDRKYMEWRKTFGALLTMGAGKAPSFGDKPVELRLVFGTDHVSIAIMEMPTGKRPKHVRADLDNLVGAVMEVLEDQGVIVNDRQVVKLTAYAYQEER